MGILDKFRNKKQNVNPIDNRPQKEKKEFDVTYGVTTDARLQVEFHDNEADFKQFYDITRLIVSGSPLNIAGQEVYDCMVSWYGSSDCHVLDKRTGQLDSPRATAYRGVLAQIDLDLLQKNPEYCNAVMKGLLNRMRVERYLEQGLQETPKQPCGKYIGGVRENESGYEKFFMQPVGQANHDSDFMRNRRQENRERLEAARQSAIASKQSQIAKLQAEIDGMNK